MLGPGGQDPDLLRLLPTKACASTAHSIPLDVSSIMFCTKKVRRFWRDRPNGRKRRTERMLPYEEVPSPGGVLRLRAPG